MVVDGAMLAAELRRRRARPRSLAASIADDSRRTWVLGDLREAPISSLVLAALSLTERPIQPPSRRSLGGTET